MNKLVRVICLGALLPIAGYALSAPEIGGTPAIPDAESVRALTRKIADWQIETFDQQGKYRALPRTPPDWMHREQYHDLEWQLGALYAGMNQWRKVADDPMYTEWLMAIGERNQWQLHERPYHADDHVVGQFYLSLYEDFTAPEMLEPTRERFDWILENRNRGTLDWEAEDTHAHIRWGWCDALFMAPPVWARLAKLTGDERYLKFLDEEYRATYDLLWSEKDHLFWRDSTYFTQSEKNGEDIFWARGNGWVFAGLALMIPDLPASWDGRSFYLDTYREMAERLVSIQRADGTWSMGLLGGTDGYPIKETSGTAFFAFGLAWGINEGILDRDTYLPVVLRAWQALRDSVTNEGLLGYVQPVGAAPGDSFPDYTEVYGVGAMLAAGSEIYKLLLAEEGMGPRVSNRARVFMHNGGWCWFQDPRAIIHDGHVIVGGVAGNGRGDAAVAVYSLANDVLLGRTTIADNFDHDDHNAPAFHPRPDGRLLTVYARHSTENKHYYRVSTGGDFLDWGEEQVINHDDPVTYMNLFYLADEDRLYNFFRGIDWNPSFVVSDHNGDSWGQGRHFIKDELQGTQRPYARYTGNGKDTIAVSFTDAHPRDFGTSIYYAEFRDGRFYRADKRLIKKLDTDGPLTPSEAERIFSGGGGRFRGVDASAYESAWVSAIELDENGNPHIGYTLYLSNTDQRYRLASWDGRQWIDREVAYAGTRLYDREASYTGLIALDPADPRHVVISSDVHPTTGKPLNGKHQIFRAEVSPADSLETIHWQQLTDDNARDNIRPLIVNGDGHSIILWLRGRYDTYTDYYLDVVGIVR